MKKSIKITEAQYNRLQETLIDEAAIRNPEAEGGRPNLHAYHQDPNAEKPYKEVSEMDGGKVQIQSKEDARCPDGKCVMYNLSFNGKAIYEFASTSFKGLSVEAIAQHIFKSLSLNGGTVTEQDCIEMATELSKYLKR